MAKSSLDKMPVPLVRDYGDLMTLVFEGKVYHVTNPTVGTPVVGQTSYAATLATITLRNLGDRLMIPLYAKFVQSGTVAGGRIIYNVQVLESDQFTSGTALTVKNSNWRFGDTPGVLAYHTATIPTLTTGNARLVTSGEIFQTVSAANADNTLDAFAPMGSVAVRPKGGLNIYTNAATTGPGWSFNIAWAEIDV